jgi:Transposase
MLNELRRELYREATTFQCQVLKGVRWLLMKRIDNLDCKKKGNRTPLPFLTIGVG